MPRWPSLHLRLPPRTPSCTASCHVCLGESQSDTLAGVLERGHEVGVSRGKLLAAVVVLSCLGACRSPGLAGTQGASRQAFLVCLEWPSRQAPLAGVLSPWREFFVLEWLQRNHGGSWRSPGKPCRRMLRLPVHKFGILGYPYSSTPTGAPGPGPYTVPSAVGPGPKQGTGTRGLGYAESCSVSTVPSPNGTR